MSILASTISDCRHCGLCHSDDHKIAQVQVYRDVASNKHYVWCEGCGAEGEHHHARGAAIRAWSRGNVTTPPANNREG